MNCPLSKNGKHILYIRVAIYQSAMEKQIWNATILKPKRPYEDIMEYI